MKYIFVTGGVVSSLGKGIAAAALGYLLEQRGLRVMLQKFDPYLNVDPGTMSPYQHGEVYVLADGTETDLDLGYYERFTHCQLSSLNSLTSGRVYKNVLRKERRGKYLGKTVQVVPHVTDEIKLRLRQVARKSPDTDILITEIGGTTGDIEGLPFLEAIRQFRLDVGPRNVAIMHVTPIIYMRAAGELKTKPSQQSIAKLREIGLHPDILVCRTEKPLDKEIREKLSFTCNVARDAVIEARDAETIYETPILLQSEGLDDVVCEHFGLDLPPADIHEWERFVSRVKNPRRRINIALVGKYSGLQDAYKSIAESFVHAGAFLNCGVNLVPVDPERLEIKPTSADTLFNGMDGILVPGGFGERGIEGKIIAARYAREKKIPYLGICLGMQVATIEFARHVCSIHGASSMEFDTPDKKTPHPVIAFLPGQQNLRDKGGTMRLGSQTADILPGTLTHRIYASDTIEERHRHRYEYNMAYREQMEAKGFLISATSHNGALVELIELPAHPWFVACQFHPEFQSRPNSPHPLFRDFVAASLQRSSAPPAP